jgi:hypothetical protein
MGGQMQNAVTNELAVLKNSVTFAMSLGAKELFHTNFIAFLLENDDPSLLNIRQNIANLFGITITSQTKIYTWREKYNLDLVIIAIDWNYSKIDEDVCDSIESCDSVDSILNAQVCVIEAKLKSLPTLDQLIGYDKKLETTRGLNFDLNDYDYLQWNMHGQLTGFKLIYDQGTNVQTLRPIYGTRINNIHIINPVVFEKILLSQITLPICTCTSSICTCIPTACKWNQKKWNDIAQAINTGVNIQNSSNPGGLNAIINDYAVHLDNLANLICKVIGYSRSNFASKNKFTYEHLCIGINAPEFKKTRIHDLVGKVVFNDLEQRLFSAINLFQCNKLQISHKTFYSNQQPGINFEWCYEKPVKGVNNQLKSKKIFRIGVEIQGSHYRHYIATNTNWNNLKNIADKMHDWFFPKGSRNLKLHGKKKKNNKDNINSSHEELYKFDVNKFVYSKMKLDEENFDQLSENIKYSMSLACLIMTPLINGKDLDGYFN